MEDSIFKSIKELLGPDSDYDAFDNDILIQINMALSILTQVGVGPENGFIVTGEEQNWSDFLGSSQDLEMVKSYVYMQVKMAFDPPANSFVLTHMKEACEEYIWRLSVATDKGV